MGWVEVFRCHAQTYAGQLALACKTPCWPPNSNPASGTMFISLTSVWPWLVCQACATQAIYQSARVSALLADDISKAENPVLKTVM